LEAAGAGVVVRALDFRAVLVAAAGAAGREVVAVVSVDPVAVPDRVGARVMAEAQHPGTSAKAGSLRRTDRVVLLPWVATRVGHVVAMLRRGDDELASAVRAPRRVPEVLPELITAPVPREPEASGDSDNMIGLHGPCRLHVEIGVVGTPVAI